MAKQSWRPGTLLAPVPPVLVSSGDAEHPNVFTAAWTGIVCSEPAMTYVSIRPSRYSHEIISRTGEFVINLPCAAVAKAVDYCGVKSGREVDKFQLTGLKPEPSAAVAAPSIAQCPVSLECKVRQVMPLGSHDMFLAEIVAVGVEEQYIDEKGALHLEKCGLLAYSHGAYFTLGKQLGTFGFSVRKKSSGRRKK